MDGNCTSGTVSTLASSVAWRIVSPSVVCAGLLNSSRLLSIHTSFEPLVRRHCQWRSVKGCGIPHHPERSVNSRSNLTRHHNLEKPRSRSPKGTHRSHTSWPIASFTTPQRLFALDPQRLPLTARESINWSHVMPL